MIAEWCRGETFGLLSEKRMMSGRRLPATDDGGGGPESGWCDEASGEDKDEHPNHGLGASAAHLTMPAKVVNNIPMACLRTWSNPPIIGYRSARFLPFFDHRTGAPE